MKRAPILPSFLPLPKKLPSSPRRDLLPRSPPNIERPPLATALPSPRITRTVPRWRPRREIVGSFPLEREPPFLHRPFSFLSAAPSPCPRVQWVLPPSPYGWRGHFSHARVYFFFFSLRPPLRDMVPILILCSFSFGGILSRPSRPPFPL